MSQEPAKASVQPMAVRKEEAEEYYFQEGCYILELHNSSNDSACSIARARVSKGQRTRLHSLQGTIERYYIQSGRGIVRVGDNRYEVQPGSVVVIPENTPQSIVNMGEEDVVFLVICTPRFRHECYRDLEDGSQPSVSSDEQAAKVIT